MPKGDKTDSSRKLDLSKLEISLNQKSRADFVHAIAELLDVYHMDSYESKMSEIILINQGTPYEETLTNFARALYLVREAGEAL